MIHYRGVFSSCPLLRTYPLAFRNKVLDLQRQEGLSVAETGRRFHIGVATLCRWQKQIVPRTVRNKPATKIDMQALAQDLQAPPDSYQWERARTFGVTQSPIFSALQRLGKSYKKNPFSPPGG